MLAVVAGPRSTFSGLCFSLFLSSVCLPDCSIQQKTCPKRYGATKRAERAIQTAAKCDEAISGSPRLPLVARDVPVSPASGPKKMTRRRLERLALLLSNGSIGPALDS